MPQDSSHRVAVLVGEGSNAFEMGVATELFGLRRPELGRPWQDFTLCAAEPAVRMHLGLLTLSGVAGLDAADAADTLIVPSRPGPLAPAARRFVEDGTVLTAAGSAAALDLGLHLSTAITAPRSPTRSAGGWSSPATATAATASSSSARCPPSRTRRWPRCWPARERLDQPLTVADPARWAAASPATLHRRFRAELGTTPLAWLTAERITLACRLIELGEPGLDRGPAPAD